MGISLLFKSFVIDNISDPDQVCEACEGKAKVTMKLRRPSKQRKEDDKFEKALKLKLKEQYGANEDEVEIDFEGIVKAKVNLNLLLNRDGVNKTKKVKEIESLCKLKNKMASSNKELESTKQDLENTKQDLENTKQQLENTKQELENTKQQLEKANQEASNLKQKTLDCVRNS